MIVLSFHFGFFGLPPSFPFSRAAFDFALLLTLPRSAAVQTGQIKGVEHFLQRFMMRDACNDARSIQGSARSCSGPPSSRLSFSPRRTGYKQTSFRWALRTDCNAFLFDNQGTQYRAETESLDALLLSICR